MVRGSLPQTMVRDRFHDFIMTLCSTLHESVLVAF